MSAPSGAVATEAEITGQAVVYISVAQGALLLVAISLFGPLMEWRAIRWQVLNSSIWNIIHIVVYASLGDKSPWYNYLNDADYKDDFFVSFKILCLTTFPAGMVWVYMETILVYLVPSLRSSGFLCLLSFLLIFGLNNILLVAAYYMKYIYVDEMETIFWFDPILMFQVVVVCMFFVLILVYIIVAAIMHIWECFRKGSHPHRHGSELWSVLLYGVIPFPIYAVTSGATLIGYIGSKLPDLKDWLMEMAMCMAMNKCPAPPVTQGPGTGTTMGPVNRTTTSTTTTTTQAPPIDIDFLMFVIRLVNDVFAWTESTLPLVEILCAVVLIKSYRQTFLLLLSCDRFFAGRRSDGLLFTRVSPVGDKKEGEEKGRGLSLCHRNKAPHSRMYPQH